MGAKATHDIAPQIRAGFVRAAARKGNGDAISAIADQIEKNWDDNFLAVLAAVAKFMPREVSGKIDHEHKHAHTHTTAELSDTDRIIAEAIAAGEARALPQSH